MRKEDKIDEDVWNFLLTGGYSKGSTTQQVLFLKTPTLFFKNNSRGGKIQMSTYIR